jgi:hypothetical protein
VLSRTIAICDIHGCSIALAALIELSALTRMTPSSCSAITSTTTSPSFRLSGRTNIRLSIQDFVPGPHFSGKTAIIGHTPQLDLLNLGHLICLDTGCCNGGWLTAMQIDTGKLWQVDEVA